MADITNNFTNKSPYEAPDPDLVVSWAEMATYGPKWLSRNILARSQGAAPPLAAAPAVDLEKLRGEERLAEISRRETEARPRRLFALRLCSNMLFERWFSRAHMQLTACWHAVCRCVRSLHT